MDILKIVSQSGRIDPVIQRTAMQMAMSGAINGGSMMAMATQPTTEPMKVEWVRTPMPAQPQAFTAEDVPVPRTSDILSFLPGGPDQNKVPSRLRLLPAHALFPEEYMASKQPAGLTPGVPAPEVAVVH